MLVASFGDMPAFEIKRLTISSSSDMFRSTCLIGYFELVCFLSRARSATRILRYGSSESFHSALKNTGAINLTHV